MAGSDARSRWRQRRVHFILPSLILVALVATNLAMAGTGRVQADGVLVGIVVVLGVTYAGTALHGRRIRREADPDALFASFGRFPMADIQAQPRFAEMLARCDTHRITSWSRGMVEGRIILTGKAIRFAPGRIADKAGIRDFEIPWSDVSEVQVVPMRLDLNTGMEVSLLGGGVLHCEVRGEGPLRAALAAL